jgi:DUF4097 and DUF4098 domain-containing protein YvlB
MRIGGRALGPLVALGFVLAGVPALATRTQKNFKVASHPVLTVHNSSGNIVIRTWQKQEVQVIADHKSQKVDVGAELKGNMVEVSTRFLTDDLTPADLETDYQITVPQETELSIHNDSGTVDVQGVLGDLSFETVAADVDLSKVTGYVTVRTVGGSFTCNECSGRIDAHSISGAINLIGSVSQNVQASSSTGNIMLDSDLLPNGLYHLRNYSGQIDVLFSPSDSFDVSAVSMRGKVENEADLKQSQQPERNLPSFARSLFGVYNEGRARLILNSFSGTIVIRRRQ